MFATGPGQTFIAAVFIDPMRLDLGLSRTATSAVYSLASLAAALAIALSGRAIDRLGSRRSLLVFGLLMGAACLAMSLIRNRTSLLLGFLALRLLGPGALALTSGIVPLPWFIRRRGRALGVVSLGLAAGSAILPLLALSLIESVGWRTAWIALGLLVWMVVLVPGAMLVRERPKDLGLHPDGQVQIEPAPTFVKIGSGWSIDEAARTRTFWLLLIIAATTSLVSTGLVFHQVSYLAEHGLEAQTPLVFASFGVVSAVSMALTGLALDRFEARTVLLVLMLALIASIGCLLLAPRFAPVAALYGGLLGTASGGMMTAGTVVWAQFFGQQHLGTIRGVDGMVRMIAAAIGPLPPALAYDFTGAYLPGLGIFAALAAIATFATLGARNPTQREGRDHNPVPSRRT